MRVVEIQIHNFRSIHDATIQLERLSLIAGANNSGKSNVIDAIRMFFGDLKWDEARDKPKVGSQDENSWIEVEFQPTDEELSQLKESYRSPDNTFRVRNYIRPSRSTDGKVRAGYYAYENGTLSENLFYGAKNVGSGKVGHIVYIPAVSKIDDSTKLTGPSALRDLVAEVLNKVVTDSQPYQELSKAFSSFENSIKSQSSEDGYSLSLLEEEVTQDLAQWDASFSLSIQSIQPEEILKTLIKPQLIDESHGSEIDQSRFGAGFQRHLIYTLIKLAAKHANAPRAAATTKKEFAPNLTWILFEEPEAFLHPSQEEVLHDSLNKLTLDNNTQVLLTTHSSRFVSRSMDDLTKLIRLRREAGVTSSFQLSRENMDALFTNALVVDASIVPHGTTPEDVNIAAMMASLKTELWMQPNRAAAFFCNRVILVEGPSEAAVYSYLISRQLMDPPCRGLMIVDCMGKYNLHRFISIFSAFGIDHSVLYDGDNGRSHDSEVTESVDRAKTIFTKRIKRFEFDLETELGIPPVPRNKGHQKPQHALYHLEAKQVDDKKLDAFIKELVTLATAD